MFCFYVLRGEMDYAMFPFFFPLGRLNDINISSLAASSKSAVLTSILRMIIINKWKLFSVWGFHMHACIFYV